MGYLQGGGRLFFPSGALGEHPMRGSGQHVRDPQLLGFHAEGHHHRIATLRNPRIGHTVELSQHEDTSPGADVRIRVHIPYDHHIAFSLHLASSAEVPEDDLERGRGFRSGGGGTFPRGFPGRGRGPPVGKRHDALLPERFHEVLHHAVRRVDQDGFVLQFGLLLKRLKEGREILILFQKNPKRPDPCAVESHVPFIRYGHGFFKCGG